MFLEEWMVIMAMGGGFILLGLVFMFWGRGEEKDYYDTIASRRDVREFVEHSPDRPEPKALKVGGRIAIFVGLITLLIGVVFLVNG